MSNPAASPDFRPDLVETRVVICGSRGWTDKGLIWGVLEEIDRANTVIVTGGAHGADDMAAEMAHQLGFKTEVYEADWTRYGHSAGFRRNETMVHLPGVCQVIAFWDGKSRGTRDTLRRATDMGIPTVVYWDKGQMESTAEHWSPLTYWWEGHNQEPTASAEGQSG